MEWCQMTFYDFVSYVFSAVQFKWYQMAFMTWLGRFEGVPQKCWSKSVGMISVYD